MDLKKCKNCEFSTEDNELEVCPECGEELLIAEVTDNNEDLGGSKEVSENVDESDAICDNGEEVAEDIDDADSDVKAKADNKVKIITASVAFVLVLLIGFCSWYIYNGKKAKGPKDLGFDEIEGNYVTYDNFQYFNFTTEEVEVAVASDASTNDIGIDSAASSDGEVASDAAKEPETQLVTFDGTYESGFTEEYVQDILKIEYISRNNLTEQYEEYLEKNNLFMDDREGFIKEKGVSQSELDKIDAELNLSAQRLEYITNGYWKYVEGGIIEVYDEKGLIISEFKIQGNSLVSPETYYAGKIYDSEKFKGSYIGEGSSYVDTWFFYDDGNCIVKSENTADGQVQYSAGTYKNTKDCVVIDIGGQKQPFAKVKGGIAMYAFIKQK